MSNFLKPTAPARNPAKNIVSSSSKQTRQPNVPNVFFDRVPTTNTSTLRPATSTSTLPPVQETAVYSPPPAYAVTDQAALYKTLIQEAQTAGGMVSENHSGSIMAAGGKLTRIIAANEHIRENIDDSAFYAGRGIEERRDAPNIEVAHEKVISVSTGSIYSQTNARENATVKMKDTVTSAGVNLTLNPQAQKNLTLDFENVKMKARNDFTMDIPENNRVNINITSNGQQRK